MIKAREVDGLLPSRRKAQLTLLTGTNEGAPQIVGRGDDVRMKPGIE
jgi:hypothetical protein